MSTSLPQPKPVVYIALTLGVFNLFPFFFAGWIGIAALFGSDPMDAIQPTGLGTMAIGMTVLYAERGSRWSGLQKTTQDALMRYVKFVVWTPIVVAFPCIVLDVLADSSNCFGRGCRGDMGIMLTASLVVCAIGVVLLLGNWRYLREPAPGLQAL